MKLWAAAAWTTAAVIFLLPVSDPDIWWHLSAAKDFLASGLWARAESWSFAMAGVPWVNFEWLSQLAYWAAFSAGSLAGVWVLKALLLVLAAAGIQRALSGKGVSVPVQAAALSIWAAAAASRADARLELFSIAAFCWLLAYLEWGRVPRSTAAAALGLVLGALWANLHAGFVFGAALLFAYAADGAAEKRGKGLFCALAGACAGSFLNPYGWGLHEILWSHAKDAGSLGSLIVEWAPLDPTRLVHAPVWVLMAACIAALIISMKKSRSFPPLQAILLGLFGMAALRHSRSALYFSSLAVVYLPGLLGEAALRRIAAGVIALCLAFGLFLHRGRGFKDETLWPIGAVEFLSREKDLLALKSYNEWGWGGYLKAHLPEPYRVFQDGRYLFHPLLIEAKGAVSSPGQWQAFLDKYGIEAALMENAPNQVVMERLYPDGNRRAFRRPYYAAYMPKDRWALVYWDEKSLYFVRRGAIGSERMTELEYRFFRPGDEEALGDALGRGEIDLKALETERRRWGGLKQPN